MAHPHPKRILFLLKHRDYLYTDETHQQCYEHGHLTSGLLNSALLVAEMLKRLGHHVHLAQVRDNNCIDREVTRFRPDTCVIEAYWVVPEKFDVLHRRHPRVKWVVRNHSAVPFASLESVVIDWTLRYMDHPNVIVACNDARTDQEFAFLIALSTGWDMERVRRRCILLPNYYPATLLQRPRPSQSISINVGCFGAIRPLKNHLIQAVAAIEFAERIDHPIQFHINATRIEQNAHATLKNLRALFHRVGHGNMLIEHPWMKRPEFLRLCSRMDIGVHVSFSETFSIGCADLTTHGVPIVTSAEVPWVDPAFYANPNSSTDIATKMCEVIGNHHVVKRNLRGLRKFSNNSKKIWSTFVRI